MPTALRFFGIINAAIWFGAAIFFTVVVGPAFFSGEMLSLLGRPRAGAAAQLVIERYFILQHTCAIIAIIHLLAEWLYMGRPLERLTLGVVIGAFCLGLIGGAWMAPKLKQLHFVKYGQNSTPEQREAAAKSFSAWHGVSQMANLLLMVAILGHLWKMSNRADGPRFVSANKFRG